jgi:hypothetical protein
MIETFLLFVKGKALLLKMIGTASVIAIAVTSCVMRDKGIATQAVQVDRAKTEKVNVNATKKSTRAAERSRDPGVRGPVDPTTRD